MTRRTGARPVIKSATKRWTTKDVHDLRRAAEQGLNADQVATKLGRSWIDVVRKAVADGIPLKPIYETSFTYSESDEAYWNTGTPWSEDEVRDLRYAVSHGERVEEVSTFLMRTPKDVLAKATKLGLSIK
jgi:hypothetical protein